MFIGTMVENGMVLNQAYYDKQMWPEEPEKEIDYSSEQYLNRHGWDFITWNDQRELDFYSYIYNISGNMNMLDEFAARYESDKSTNPDLEEQEHEFCLDSEDWAEFVNQFERRW